MALAADPELKAKGVALYGVAQKDSDENVRRFLGAKGNPYAKVGLDPSERTGIDWGVYGVPETFVVRGDGTIAYKFVGPMTPGLARARGQAADPEGHGAERVVISGTAARRVETGITPRSPAEADAAAKNLTVKASSANAVWFLT